MAPSVIPFSSQDVGKAKGPELVAFSNIELALELNPITQQWMGSNILKLLCYFRFVQTMHHHTTRVGYNLLLNCYPGDYPICLGSSEEWKTRMFEERQRKLRDIMQLRNPISPPSLLHFWNKLKCDRWESFFSKLRVTFVETTSLLCWTLPRSERTHPQQEHQSSCQIDNSTDPNTRNYKKSWETRFYLLTVKGLQRDSSILLSIIYCQQKLQ